MKKTKALFLAEEKKTVLLVSILMFLRMSGVFLVLPVFSALASEIQGAEEQKIGLAFGAYALTQGLFQLPMGMLSDRYGRKKILLIAFSLFLAGSLLCAISNDFFWLVLGRLLQGTGAISSVIFALIGDHTRTEVRTRANALLGISIGLAFGISFAFAPFLGNFWGLNGIFGFISFLAILSLILIIGFVPSSPQIPKQTKRYGPLLKEVLADRRLRSLFSGSFAGGCGLSATMFLVPLEFKKMGILTSQMWKIYIPMLFLGILFMIPAAFFAEAKKKFRTVFFFGNGIFILSAFVGLWVFFETPTFWGVLLFLYVFFCGYNVFEPIFPSLSTKLSTPESKGTVSGVVNFFQFFGYFVGSTSAGFLYKAGHLEYFFGLLLVFYGIFFLYSLSFRNSFLGILPK